MYEKLTAYRKDFDPVGFWSAFFEVCNAVNGGNGFMRFLEAPVKAGIELNEGSFMKADVSNLSGDVILGMLLYVLGACDGDPAYYERFLLFGCMDRWLDRLAAIDAESPTVWLASVTFSDYGNTYDYIYDSSLELKAGDKVKVEGTAKHVTVESVRCVLEKDLVHSYKRVIEKA